MFFDEQKGAGWCQKTSNNLHGHICMASCQVGHEQCRCGHAVDDVSRMLHCNPFLDTEDIGQFREVEIMGSHIPCMVLLRHAKNDALVGAVKSRTVFRNRLVYK